MGEEQQQMVEVEDPFRKGSVVEVSFEEEGFRGSWYTATVVRSVSKKKKKILLEFHSLMADDKSRKPLREFVDVILVRPVPPRDEHESNNPCFRFKLSDEVDAFHNDGWWEGVVTAVLNNNSYSVFFRSSREQIDFPHSALRLHREWVHGHWVPPPLNSTSEAQAQAQAQAQPQPHPPSRRPRRRS